MKKCAYHRYPHRQSLIKAERRRASERASERRRRMVAWNGVVDGERQGEGGPPPGEPSGWEKGGLDKCGRERAGERAGGGAPRARLTNDKGGRLSPSFFCPHVRASDRESDSFSSFHATVHTSFKVESRRGDDERTFAISKSFRRKKKVERASERRSESVNPFKLLDRD